VFALPRRHAISATITVVLLAAAVAGCSGGTPLFDDKNEGGWFSKPIDIFAKPDWAHSSAATNDTDTGVPAGPDDLVGADGRCAAVTAQAPQSTPAADTSASAAAPASAEAKSVGSMAGELGGEPAPAAPAAASPDVAPPVLGGIALGMTECQAVRRAGQPGNVAISAGAKGERLVVLTYLSGPWPGIYHFSAGRLKEIDQAPVQSAPAKPPPKKKKKTVKKKPAPAQTLQRNVDVVR